jgi:hypothetical protein
MCSSYGCFKWDSMYILYRLVCHSLYPGPLNIWEPGKLSQYSVCIRTGRPDYPGSIRGSGKRIFPLTSVSIPALGPTHPPVQWVPGVLPPGVKRGR